MPKKVKKLSPGDWVKIKKSADVADVWKGKVGVFILRQDDGISRYHNLVALAYPHDQAETEVVKLWFTRSELKRVGGLL